MEQCTRPCSQCAGALKEERVVFTQEMKKTHTILIPTMLPIHFRFMANILEQKGYKVKILENAGRSVVDEGLKNVHNDTCYPALLVIGQMIDALKSGEYDLDKVALLITQTGGGCRASNYIHLLRKALQKSGFGYIPVISLNIGGLEKNPGFTLSVSDSEQLMYAVILGDLIMLLANQCRPYEVEEGETDRTVNRWIEVMSEFFRGKKVLNWGRMRPYCTQILRDFAAIPKAGKQKIRVGVVGEIYVKYSPLGNNNLEDFLHSEGAEVVVPGLLDFCLYCVYNMIEDHKLYGGPKGKYWAAQAVYRYLVGKKRKLIELIREEGTFDPPEDFEAIRAMAEGYISTGMKMGEGWLLTAEMVELIHKGINNIVCTQPFGCLPNHIAGKGMIHLIKEKNPQANIVAVDYDPGASEVNQQNRIKLMLANAAMAQ